MLASGCATAPGRLTPDQSASVHAEVQATLDAFSRHGVSGEWDALVALYADEPGFRWIEANRPGYRSVAEVRAALVSLGPGARAETVYRDIEIVPLARALARVATRFETRLLVDGEERVRFGGTLAMTLVRRQGWQVLTGHAASG